MLSRLKRNTILLISTVAIIAAIMFIASKWQGSQPIKEIEIKGNAYIEETYIRNLIYSDVLSKKPEDIDFDLVKQKILKIPLIAECKIVNSYPEKSIFLITNENIISRARGDDNTTYLFTESGSLINLEELKSNGMIFKNKTFDNLPLVNFIGTLSENKSSNNKDLVEFIKVYNKLKMGSVIKTIWKGNMGISCNLQDDKEVIFGNTINIESKFSKFLTFIDKVLSRENLNINIIDLRWKNQIIVK